MASFLFINSAKGEESESLPKGPKIIVAVSAPFFETLVTDVVSGLLRIERFLLCAVLTLIVIILLFYLKERHFGRANSFRNSAHRSRAQSHSAHLPTDAVRNHRNISHRNVSQHPRTSRQTSRLPDRLPPRSHLPIRLHMTMLISNVRFDFY